MKQLKSFPENFFWGAASAAKPMRRGLAGRGQGRQYFRRHD